MSPLGLCSPKTKSAKFKPGPGLIRSPSSSGSTTSRNRCTSPDDDHDASVALFPDNILTGSKRLSSSVFSDFDSSKRLKLDDSDGSREKPHFRQPRQRLTECWDHADLETKSLDQLYHLLARNQDGRRENSISLRNYHEGNSQDIFILKALDSIFKNRIDAIHETIASAPQSSERYENIPDFMPSTPSLRLSTPVLLPAFTAASPTIPTSSSQESNSSSGTSDLLSFSSQSQELDGGPDSDDELWNSVPDIAVPGFDTNEAARSPRKTPSSEEFTDVLKRIFGLDRFRENQLEIMLETAAGKDTVVLMPTGGRKSLCFQLPAVYEHEKSGCTTVVISPLRALIRDQVDALKAKGVHAVRLTADTGPDRQSLHDHATPALLYVTPEKLHKSRDFRDVLSNLHRKHKLARFAIDEAECIQTWGHDFRDSYRKLHIIREQFPDVPIIALTAAASPETIEKIVERLKLDNPKVFQRTFNRPNLKYRVATKRAKPHDMDDVVNFVENEYSNRKGIVYCLTRKHCESLAEYLRSRGILANHYHAGMSEEEQIPIHAGWKAGKIDVIVATVAFGMGIDQPDVRFVIHFDIPKSLEGYYQETGRAGRDGLPADCILYYRFQDLKTVLDLRDTSNEAELASQSRREAARAVVNFCEETKVCRRVQLLQHFGENFAENDCRGGCDVCYNRAALDSCEVDLSESARHAVILVESFNVNEDLTVKQAISIFRGLNPKNTKKFDVKSRPRYGAGSSLHPDVVDLVFDRLLFLDILVERRVERTKGHHYYLKPGPQANDFIATNGKIIVNLNQKSAEYARKAGPRPSSPSRDESTAARDILEPKDPGTNNCQATVELYRKLIAHQKIKSSPQKVFDAEPLQRLSVTPPRDAIRFKRMMLAIERQRFPEMSAEEAKSIVKSKFSDTMSEELLQICRAWNTEQEMGPRSSSWNT
ncbi:P-loop containing nucleoside triphosphate hydrolase protein [Mycena sanguinolenta]|nr:P-loop containing nucleoside triphosphate hydrolase protein [Mycena sanguinolenta]